MRRFRAYIVAAVLVGVAWGASFAANVSVAYGGGGAQWGLGNAPGEVFVCRWLRGPGPSVTDGFRFHVRPADPGDGAVIRALPGIHVLGFVFHHSGRSSALGWGTIVIIPFWAIGVTTFCIVAVARRVWARHSNAVRGFPAQEAAETR